MYFCVGSRVNMRPYVGLKEKVFSCLRSRVKRINVLFPGKNTISDLVPG
jgi:hypothetical protein